MPVEHMRRYFGERTVASTLDMLDEQDAAIRARIAALRDARAAVDARRARLERYDGQEPGLLRLLELPERPCLQLQEDVILEREIDFALKKLAHRHEEVIRALGTQCMGAVLDESQRARGIYNHFCSVFYLGWPQAGSGSARCPRRLRQRFLPRSVQTACGRMRRAVAPSGRTGPAAGRACDGTLPHRRP